MIEFAIVEYGFAISLFVNAALFIPQIMRIAAKKDSKEVSLITFLGFWLIQLSTTLHGFLIKDYLLAFGTLASMLPCGYVILQIVFYRITKNKNP